MFAGSLQGVTQTLPLAIYAEFDLNFDVALAIGALLVLVSGAILLASRCCSRWTALRLDFAVPLRSFDLELALEIGARDGRARRPVRRRQVARCCARSPA